MEHSKHALKLHRNVLLEELGLYEMGESGTNLGATPPDITKLARKE